MAIAPWHALPSPSRSTSCNVEKIDASIYEIAERARGKQRARERERERVCVRERKGWESGRVSFYGILFTTRGSPAFYFAFTSYATLERLRAPLLRAREGVRRGWLLRCSLTLGSRQQGREEESRCVSPHAWNFWPFLAFRISQKCVPACVRAGKTALPPCVTGR